MAEEKMMRLSQAARKLNVGTSTITDHLSAKGFAIENNPNSKITQDQFDMLMKDFASSVMDKKEASGLTIGKKHTDVVIKSDTSPVKKDTEDENEIFIKNVPQPIEATKEEPKVEEKVKQPEIQAPEAPQIEESEEESQPGSKVKLQGIKVVGKISLDKPKKEPTPVAPQPKPVVEQKPEPVAVKPAPVEEVKPTPTHEPVAKPEPVSEKKPEPVVEKKPEPVAEKAPEVEIKPAVEKPAAIVETPAPSAPSEKSVPAAEEAPTSAPIITEKITVAPATETTKEPVSLEPEMIGAKADQLKGLTVLGKIELPAERDKKKKPEASSDAHARDKKKRKRVVRPGGDANKPAGPNPNPNAPSTNTSPGFKRPRPAQVGNRPGGPNAPHAPKEGITDKEIQDKIKATLAKLSGGGPSKGGPLKRAKYRKDKRSAIAEANEERMLQEQEDARLLKVTEYISANDLASLMGVTVNDVIKTCMSLGMFVSINQRLDAEAITVIADEFGFEVDFTSLEEEVMDAEEVVDAEEDLQHRAPIITIMGHVDHGKTSLLDYIRKTKVAAGEAGGITQHIGAYSVTTETGKKITFLDTPGHEAFTAMRARGAKLTDIVIIVVAADDGVMPQTREAINHSIVAGVPIVIAINKIDKAGANPDKIKEELAKENILVEDWGGKYQVEMISAKSGLNINSLLEKVLLEAEILNLKANPDRHASGTVVEAMLDKGRGYVATVLVQTGTLKVGDVILAGANHGRVKAMMDHRGRKIETAGPSTPVQVLGLNGAPQAGEKIRVLESEREAREIATKREQVLREQSIRTKKHITLDEIGRRLAIGNFKELNIIVKGDVDGSVEALSDSLLKLSTEEIQIRILHKGVGQISESDVLLASASDAIIIGFQVRPSSSARKLADNEEIEIRLYSIIYDAINEIKDAMEGMLEPTVEEIITGNIEVRDVFKITKVGTVAGCYVTDGIIKRSHKVRLVRDGIVVHTGQIDALKRFKDDVSEVRHSYECGLSLKNFNDIQVGDTIEAFETKEVKRTL